MRQSYFCFILHFSLLQLCITEVYYFLRNLHLIPWKCSMLNKRPDSSRKIWIQFYSIQVMVQLSGFHLTLYAILFILSTVIKITNIGLILAVRRVFVLAVSLESQLSCTIISCSGECTKNRQASFSVILQSGNICHFKYYLFKKS